MGPIFWGDGGNPKNMQMYGDVGGVSLIKVFNSFLSHPKNMCSKWVILQGKSPYPKGTKVEITGTNLGWGYGLVPSKAVFV